MADDVRDYVLSPILRARFMGLFLAAAGVLLLGSTILLSVLDGPMDVVVVLAVLVVIAIFTLGSAMTRRWFVVRFDETGYQVRFIRGAGVRTARWTDVADLQTTTVLGNDCVVIGLRDGSRTTIPVTAIEGDQELFVDELRRRLGSGPGRRGAGGPATSGA